MKEYHVNIPEESFKIIEFKQDHSPGIARINQSLKDFGPKEVFSWHCSILLELEDVISNGMPSREERFILQEFEDWLNLGIAGSVPKKPNALFLGRITWNETRELIWRVFDAEKAYQFLLQIIEADNHPRQFDYRIDPDPEWKLAEWHLSNC